MQPRRAHRTARSFADLESSLFRPRSAGECLEEHGNETSHTNECESRADSPEDLGRPVALGLNSEENPSCSEDQHEDRACDTFQHSLTR